MPPALPPRITAHLCTLALFSPSPPAAESSDFSPGEEVFGIYRNNVAAVTKAIVLTDSGIHIQYVDRMRYVPYMEMLDISWHTWDQSELKEPLNRRLIISVKTSEQLEVHVVGAKGAILDMVSLHNFLLGAVQTRRLESRRVVNRQ
jgi:hypothetical protein